MRDRKTRPALTCEPWSPARSRHSRVAIAVAAALAGAGAPATAALAAEAGGESTGPTLQEVVVTARKRTENIQDVPVSINVFTSEELKRLAVTRFEDYAEKTPSVSFISTGPGTQLFVMRGVADGSNPTYSNTSATGFFVDDMSTSWAGVQPDMHLYDLERIEVLNGPQGTTFGAGSMSGAIRYITAKPNVNTFGAGLDFNAGKIQGGQSNWTYEGFINVPLIPGTLGLRASAFSDSRGGFINNQLVTRTWINGSVSNNAPWARDNYNRAHVEGGRVTLKYVLNDGWNGTLMYMFQRQNTLGAWDEDPNRPPRTVQRFGPESHRFEARMLDAHIDGDLGIADLVLASTYWSLPTRQNNEYSQYMQNYKGGAQEGFTCLNDPTYGTGPFTGCKPPLQFYEYHTNPERWSNELRLLSKAGGRFHWLAGLYWEKTRDKNSGSTYFMPYLRTDGAAWNYYLNYYGTSGSSLPPQVWYAYHTRTDSLQTTEFANISFDLLPGLTVEAGAVHFHSDARYYSPYAQFAYQPVQPGLSVDTSSKVNYKGGISYKITSKAMVYADFAQGFRPGGSNSGFDAACYAKGVPHSYDPDTLNNFEIGWKTASLANRLIWNGAAYWMNWKKLQTLVYDIDVCPPSSFNANIGDARIRGVETNLDFRPDEHWTLQLNASYNDPHLLSSAFAKFPVQPGERLPYSPWFSWSWNARYQHPLAGVNGYAQLDVAHKGNMWNDLHISGSHGIPRALQPGYSIVNFRVGLGPESDTWLAEAYVTNLLDKNAIIYTNTYNFDFRQTTNEPRVVGLRLSYRFGKQ